MNRDSQPYFVISVVSRMFDVHPQTIRHYERLGLLNPHRTDGNIRLYSRKDIERLEQICSFTNLGVNLAGVEIIVNLIEKMEAAKAQMQQEMMNMQQEIQRLRTELSRQNSENDDINAIDGETGQLH